MNKNFRIALGVVLGIIIISMCSYTYLHKDELFTSTINIKYIDGCTETYKNTELVTPECEMGRQKRLGNDVGGYIGEWPTTPITIPESK